LHWLSILGIGITANLDNLGIGVSFGARSIRVPFISNVIISVLSMIAAYLSITLGNIVSNLIPSNLANSTGGIMIILIGIWSIKSDLKSRVASNKDNKSNPIYSLLNDPRKADKDGNNLLSWKESFMLGIALAINCMAGGFGAGVTGLSPSATTISIGMFSLLSVAVGVQAGQQITKTWFGKWSNLMGGILLVGIGFYEIFV
jgi:putative sporulation protein YtaF